MDPSIRPLHRDSLSEADALSIAQMASIETVALDAQIIANQEVIRSEGITIGRDLLYGTPQEAIEMPAHDGATTQHACLCTTMTMLEVMREDSLDIDGLNGMTRAGAADYHGVRGSIIDAINAETSRVPAIIKPLMTEHYRQNPELAPHDIEHLYELGNPTRKLSSSGASIDRFDPFIKERVQAVSNGTTNHLLCQIGENIFGIQIKKTGFGQVTISIYDPHGKIGEKLSGTSHSVYAKNLTVRQATALLSCMYPQTSGTQWTMHYYLNPKAHSPARPITAEQLEKCSNFYILDSSSRSDAIKGMKIAYYLEEDNCLRQLLFSPKDIQPKLKTHVLKLLINLSDEDTLDETLFPKILDSIAPTSPMYSLLSRLTLPLDDFQRLCIIGILSNRDAIKKDRPIDKNILILRLRSLTSTYESNPSKLNERFLEAQIKLLLAVTKRPLTSFGVNPRIPLNEIAQAMLLELTEGSAVAGDDGMEPTRPRHLEHRAPHSPVEGRSRPSVHVDVDGDVEAPSLATLHPLRPPSPLSSPARSPFTVERTRHLSHITDDVLSGASLDETEEADDDIDDESSVVSDATDASRSSDVDPSEKPHKKDLHITGSVDEKIDYWRAALRKFRMPSSFLILLEATERSVQVAACNLLLIITEKKISDPGIRNRFYAAIDELISTSTFRDQQSKLKRARDIMQDDDASKVDPAKYARSIGLLHHLFDEQLETDGSSLPKASVLATADRTTQNLIARLTIGHVELVKEQTALSPPSSFAPAPSSPSLLDRIETARRAAFIKLAGWRGAFRSDETKLKIGKERFKKLPPNERVTHFAIAILKGAETEEKTASRRKKIRASSIDSSGSVTGSVIASRDRSDSDAASHHTHTTVRQRRMSTGN